MTSRTEAGVTTTYAYNPMRMMKEASEAGVTLAKYEYDALGRRIISWIGYTHCTDKTSGR